MNRKNFLMLIQIIAFGLISLIPTISWANGVYVKNTKILNPSINNTAEIKFDISWKNSWRYPNAGVTGNDFRDAVWVFAKYRDLGTTSSPATNPQWKHVKLKGTGSLASLNTALSSSGNTNQYSAGSSADPLSLYVPQDTVFQSGGETLLTYGIGAFLERSGYGQGDISATDVKLVWDWNLDSGSGIATDHNVEVKVFAIEMVYINQGKFYLGSGSNQEKATFYLGSSPTSPFLISSEGQNIVEGTGSSNLNFNNSDAATNGSSKAGNPSYTILNVYPRGYNAFYLMKYELSQGAYVDFLNTLTRTQQQVHIATTSGLAISSANTGGKYVLSNSASLQYRNYIKAPPAGDSSYTALSSTLPLTFGVDANSNGVFNEVDSVTGTPLDGQAIACNYLNWVDLTAYADWAGLRPYTEFEFEKAARGTDMNAPNLVAHSATTPVDREFVWGSKRVINPKAIVNSALADETADVVNAKEAGVANYKSLINGPLRSGFAATSNASRLESGASYYGVMDLSGNLYEHIVSAGRNLGANFHGNVTGNGELDSFGYADIANWPGYQTVSGNSYINSGDGSGYRGGSWTSDIDPATLMSELHTSDRSIAGYDDYGAAGPNGSRFNNVGVRLGKTAYPQPY